MWVLKFILKQLEIAEWGKSKISKNIMRNNIIKPLPPTLFLGKFP